MTKTESRTTHHEPMTRTSKDGHKKIRELHKEMDGKATKEKFVILTVWDDTATDILTKDDGTVTNNWPFSKVMAVCDSIEDAKARLKKDAARFERVTDEAGNKQWLVYPKDKPLTPAFMITETKFEE